MIETTGISDCEIRDLFTNIRRKTNTLQISVLPDRLSRFRETKRIPYGNAGIGTISKLFAPKLLVLLVLQQKCREPKMEMGSVGFRFRRKSRSVSVYNIEATRSRKMTVVRRKPKMTVGFGRFFANKPRILKRRFSV